MEPPSTLQYEDFLLVRLVLDTKNKQGDVTVTF
jgi:hypothetical protein